jgi:hypothetical protein
VNYAGFAVYLALLVASLGLRVADLHLDAEPPYNGTDGAHRFVRHWR